MPDLLYVSPVVPLLTGNGLAMRAGNVLESLSESYTVSLLVVTLYPPYVRSVPKHFDKLCRRTAVVAPPRGKWDSFWSPQRWFGPWATFRRLSPDLIHVFRLATVAYAQPFLNRHSGRALNHLDLDDIESTTRNRIACLCRANGDDLMARSEEMHARRQENAEQEAFDAFGRIYVCSEADRAVIQSRSRAEVFVLPNAVRLPATPPDPGDPRRGNFLLVGTLGYYPNEDGVRYLCSDIVPLIRSQWRGDFQVDIAGPGASERLVETMAQAGVRAHGWVRDLGPLYGAADTVVVPVRAGGGTRIKILEAFRYMRPVVTTPQGIEGIDARHEEHVLVGRTAEEFAGHCVRLMMDPALGERLSRNAWELLRSRYSLDVLKTTIASSLPSRFQKESRSAAALPCAK